jgi:hypothetical protein
MVTLRELDKVCCILMSSKRSTEFHFEWTLPLGCLWNSVCCQCTESVWRRLKSAEDLKLANWTDEALNDSSETEAQIMSAAHFVTVLGVSGSY